MKKVLTAIVTFIFGICLVSATVATASAASVKKVSSFKASATPVAVTLTWKKASGAKTYELQQKSGKKWKTVTTTKKTTYTVKKLKNGTTYQFRVRAVNGKTKSAYVTAKVKTGVEKITSVKAVSTGLTSAKITWAKANVTGYEIQKKDGKKWKTVKKVKAKTTSLSVSKLSAGAKTSFRIRGYVDGAAKTYYGAYTTVNVTTAVPAMSKTAVKSVTDTSVTLSWAKVSGATGYEVQKYVSGKWVAAHSKAISSKTTSLTVKSLSPFTNYQFRVRAVQKSGKKNYYNGWATVNAKTKISNVSGVAYSSLTASTVKVTWKTAGGAAGYRVLNNGTKIADVKTNYANLTIKSGTAYKITVVPYNGSTVGTASAAVSFTSPCAKVTGLKKGAVNDTSITVSWAAATGRTSYQVQYSKDGKNWTTLTTTATSYTLINLASNTEYQIRVRALNKNGSTTQYGAFSDVIKERTSGLSGAADKNAINLNWKAVSGAAKYAVERYIPGGQWIELARVAGTSYTDVTDGINLYRIKALDASSKVIYTSQGFTAAAVGYSVVKDDYKITVSWEAVPKANGYKVVRASQNNLEETKRLGKNETSCTFELAPGLIHEFRIVAVIDGRDVNLTDFGVEAAKVNINDKTDSGINAQLLYLAEAINRTKYDNEHITTIYNRSQTVNSMNYIEFGIADVGDSFTLLLLAFESSFKDAGLKKGVDYEIKESTIICKNSRAVDALFASIDDGSSGNPNNVLTVIETKGEFNNTVKDGSGKVYTKNKQGQYANPKSYTLYNAVQPGDSMAYIYNSSNPSAWKNGFESVKTTKVDGGYQIVAVLKTETANSAKKLKANYHSGLISLVSAEDIIKEFQGDELKLKDSHDNTVVGKTTITAVIDEECRLMSYKVDTDYLMDVDAVLTIPLSETSGVDLKFALIMSCNESDYSTFTRS